MYPAPPGRGGHEQHQGGAGGEGEPGELERQLVAGDSGGLVRDAGGDGRRRPPEREGVSTASPAAAPSC